MEFIELKNIGKKFHLLKENNNLGRVDRTLRNPPTLSEFWAIRNINMQICRGEVIGIIGRNGAGKTTLLKIAAGIFPPSEGKLEIKGKISSIFTIGVGFQNELSGRENIYLNGSILGMKNDAIDKKLQNIIDFSELNDYIDMPLGTYSNGMRMRLGFSIAIHTDFDILLIDEVLSVGDISFQNKCFKTLLEHKQKGKAMLLVTQSLNIIAQFCDRVFLMEEGSIIFTGPSQEAIDRYRKLLNEKEFYQRKNRDFIRQTKKWAEDMKHWGKRETTDEVVIHSVQILDKWGRRENKFTSKDKVRIKLDFETHRQLDDIHFGIALFREDGVYCYGPNSRWDGYRVDLCPGKGYLIFEYDNLFLAPGIYYLSVVIWEKEEAFAYDYHRGCYKVEIIGKDSDGQLLNLPFKCRPFLWRSLLYRKDPIDIKELQYRGEMEEAAGDRIIKVEFLDKDKKPKSKFVTGQELNIKAIFELDKEKFSKKDLRLWMGIFRSDGIYCQGISQKIYHKNKELFLIYPKLRLLPGDYVVSVGFWDSRAKEFVVCYHKTYSFKVIFTKKDHGTVYLSHKWRLKLPLGAENER